jgi:NADH dehydrogenase FAD-containing subunit
VDETSRVLILGGGFGGLYAANTSRQDLPYESAALREEAAVALA